MLRFRPALQSGFTLLELMVASALGLFILSAVGSVVAGGLAAYAENLKHTRLQQELRATLALITGDLRRSGAWARPTATDTEKQSIVGAVNPFTTAEHDLRVAGSCLLFSYDFDRDGTLDRDERLGYRLGKRQAVERRKSGRTCTQSGWEKITDERTVALTRLDFRLREMPLYIPERGTVTVRSVSVSLTGQLRRDPTIALTLVTHIRIRNDRFRAAEESEP